MAPQKDLPFGSWPSPITANMITSSSVGMGDLAVSSTNELYWKESRPTEGGRQCVVRYAPNDSGASERNAVDVTPTDANVRTRVHEYGGGAYLLAPDSVGGGVIYSDFATQRLMWTKPDMPTPLCLTPEAVAPDGQYRFADGCVDEATGTLYCVREDHGRKGDATPANVKNEVVAVPLDGSGVMRVIATGSDFYAAPRVSPDGEHVAYVTWDHPSMPWDATELRIAAKGSPAATGGHLLVDGADGDTSVLQPAWHPKSGALYYLTDASGYYNLMRTTPPFAASAQPRTRQTKSDFGGGSPGWQLSQQGYVFLADGSGRIAAPYPDRYSGKDALLVFDDTDDADDAARSEHVFSQEDGLPDRLYSLAPASDGTVYMVGGSPDKPAAVYAWKGLATAAPAEAELLASSSSSDIDSSFIARPKPVEFPTSFNGAETTAYAYYYPPTNADYTSSESAPPLLVKAHGGPTACTDTGFNLGIQYWTSRGFAILDVDYGGSTGYGKEYRRRLRGNWGVVDIDDVCAGALHMVRQGLADAKRLAIDGGSAGGYTTLGALAFKDVFTAGCSKYGIGDLTTLAGDTHKFESRYLDGLVGPFPETKPLYEERAPINSVDTLSCPILLLQGDEDKVVPPNQAELMHKALLDKQLPCALKMYKGEQHGFRKAENIEDALNSEYYFFSRVFGFDCADPSVIPFEIDNLA